MADNREISFQSALRNVCEQLASKWNQQSMEDATVRAEHGLEPLQSYTINLDSANGNFTDPRLATVQGTVLLRWSPTLWKDIATQADENGYVGVDRLWDGDESRAQETTIELFRGNVVDPDEEQPQQYFVACLELAEVYDFAEFGALTVIRYADYLRSFEDAEYDGADHKQDSFEAANVLFDNWMHDPESRIHQYGDMMRSKMAQWAVRQGGRVFKGGETLHAKKGGLLVHSPLVAHRFCTEGQRPAADPMALLRQVANEQDLQIDQGPQPCYVERVASGMLCCCPAMLEDVKEKADEQLHNKLLASQLGGTHALARETMLMFIVGEHDVERGLTAHGPQRYYMACLEMAQHYDFAEFASIVVFRYISYLQSFKDSAYDHVNHKEDHLLAARALFDDWQYVQMSTTSKQLDFMRAQMVRWAIMHAEEVFEGGELEADDIANNTPQFSSISARALGLGGQQAFPNASGLLRQFAIENGNEIGAAGDKETDESGSR